MNDGQQMTLSRRRSTRSLARSVSYVHSFKFVHKNVRPETILIVSDDYNMQHDIYSLGVCLLEIGLWETFVEYDGGDARSPSMKDNLVTLTRDALPKVMGIEYANVVETCLTCLDAENDDFNDPNEFRDLEGVSVGIRYIEKVLLRLNDLRV
ncbi:hypothetical protein F5Y19DRAFT_491032 [Xylariaceae sp. FL1651]|nr:hypothetical protein F5Y19DRAFT_491032 [Xylariaceae sp. FL1651]